MKNLMSLLFVLSLVCSGCTPIGCIGEEESQIEIHEEALTATINGTTSSDNYCLTSTLSGGLNRWACRYSSNGTSSLLDLDGFDHYNFYVDKGNDTVVVSSTDVCECECPNVNESQFGDQVGFVYPDPGNNSSVINLRDTPDTTSAESGNDRFFGGSGRTQFSLFTGTNTARGGRYRDVMSGGTAPGFGAGTQTMYDPGFDLDPGGLDDLTDGGSGIDYIRQVDCTWNSCTCGSSLDWTQNCPGADCGGVGADCENTMNITAPACPAGSFPQW